MRPKSICRKLSFVKKSARRLECSFDVSAGKIFNWNCRKISQICKLVQRNQSVHLTSWNCNFDIVAEMFPSKSEIFSFDVQEKIFKLRIVPQIFPKTFIREKIRDARAFLFCFELKKSDIGSECFSRFNIFFNFQPVKKGIATF